MKVMYKTSKMVHSRYGYAERVETRIQPVADEKKVMELVEKLRQRPDVFEIRILKN